VRAAVYVRQSKDQHQTGLAVERQRQDCHRLAADRGWAVVDTFTDNDVSASSGRRRPQYEEMLSGLRGGRFEAVVVWDLDRLTRRPIEIEEFISLADRHQVALASVGGDCDLSTDNGRLFARIKGAVARAEVERKSERQVRAARQAAESGRPPSRRAFGFAPGGMEHLENEAAVVRDAYGQLLAGATLVTITKRMNEAGHRSTRGKPWTRTMVRAMLLNSRNGGIRTYRGEEVGAGSWPPIVPEETWRAAVALLGDPGRRTNQGTARRWLGGGLYRCGRCDSDVRVAYREGKVRVYACRASKHLSRVADPIDELVEGVVVARLRRSDVVDLLTQESPDLVALREESRGLRLRLDQLAEDYADDVITGRQLQVATRRVEDRLKEVARRLASAGRESRLGLVTAADDPGRAFLDLDVSARQTVVDALAVVTLLPARPGRAPFDPKTVSIVWRTS
jgi:site-specific DNA recombinase